MSNKVKWAIGLILGGLLVLGGITAVSYDSDSTGYSVGGY